MCDVADIFICDADGEPVVVRRIRHFREPVFAREGQCADTRKHHVGRFFHDAARNADRADKIPQSRDRASFARPAIHDGRIELHIAGAVRGGATSGHVQAAGFEFCNRVCDDIKRGCAVFQLLLAGGPKFALMLFGFGVVATGDRACAAM